MPRGEIPFTLWFLDERYVHNNPNLSSISSSIPVQEITPDTRERCPGCKGVIDEGDFVNEESKRIYKDRKICQNCQDEEAG